MAARKSKSGSGNHSGSRRRRSDPGQLNLFEDGEQRAPPRPAAKAAIAKPARVKAAPAERPTVLSPREAAAYLKVSVATLKSWRAKKIGPAWRRRGARLVSYFPADLEAFLRDGARSHDKT
jgi:hypothetical protein